MPLREPHRAEGSRMEVHTAPGPPRTSIVLAGGRRLAVLEVGSHRETGTIVLTDGSRYELERPPGTAEWWFHGPGLRATGTLLRSRPLTEHFRIYLDGLDLEVTRVDRGWRRRWDVVDGEHRTLVQVVQRRLARPVHDVQVRSGDLPPALPWVVAWTVALVAAPPVVPTRRPPWTTDLS